MKPHDFYYDPLSKSTLYYYMVTVEIDGKPETHQNKVEKVEDTLDSVHSLIKSSLAQK